MHNKFFVLFFLNIMESLLNKMAIQLIIFWQVAVNGQHFAEFGHRIPVHYVNTLNIEGELTLTGIKFEGGGV